MCWEFNFVHCLFVRCLVVGLLSPLFLNAQANMGITELEEQFGNLKLTPELQVEHELRMLEKSLQELDTTYFYNGLNDSISVTSFSNSVSDYSPLKQIVRFAIKAMKKRGLNTIDSLGYPPLFDFIIKDLSLAYSGNKVIASGNLEFTHLREFQISGGDTTYASYYRSFRAHLKIKERRWKMNYQQGMFDFFFDCIHLLNPNAKQLSEDLRRLEKFRQGYPNISELRKQGAGHAY